MQTFNILLLVLHSELMKNIAKCPESEVS